MKRPNIFHLFAILFVLLSGCSHHTPHNADIYSIDAPTDTLVFRQAPFTWHITPRYDYSKTLVLKIFLSGSKHLMNAEGNYYADAEDQNFRLNIEQALELIKRMDALTPGLQKIVYLVGWQYNGHDSKYPAFFEGNERIKRPSDKDALESVRWIMSEAKKYNTIVSLHINLVDVYLDSPLYDEYLKENVLCKDSEGKLYLCKWGNKICYPAEWEKGLLQKRLDSLCQILPIQDAGTIHVDAYLSVTPGLEPGQPMSPGHGYTHEQDIETQQKIIKYLDDKGIDMTTEFVQSGVEGKAFDGYIPMYYHFGSLEHALSYTAQQVVGGDASFGNNCKFLNAFGVNYCYENVFSSHFPNEEPSAIDEAIEDFKARFCTTSLICQYLNTFGRKALVTDKDWSNNDVIGVFEDGVRTHYKNGKMHMAKDGNILAEGGDVFIPAVWLGDESVIAYSENGYNEKTWTIPTGVKLPRNAKAWILTQDGKKEFDNLKIKGRQVTLTLTPGQMVLIAKQ